MLIRSRDYFIELSTAEGTLWGWQWNKDFYTESWYRNFPQEQLSRLVFGERRDRHRRNTSLSSLWDTHHIYATGTGFFRSSAERLHGNCGVRVPTLKARTQSSLTLLPCYEETIQPHPPWPR